MAGNSLTYFRLVCWLEGHTLFLTLLPECGTLSITKGTALIFHL